MEALKMKKLMLVLAMVLFLAAFAMAQVTYTQPGPATMSPGSITTPGGISTNQSQPGYNNGSTASGGPLTNGGGSVGTQGNSAPVISGTTPSYTGNVIGVLNYIPNYDVMGAHENGGRGCAGCHAPHNGAAGNGGTGNGTGGTFYNAQGGLWGEDTSAILAAGTTIVFNGGNSHHSGTLTWGNGITLTAANAWSDATYTGVATCLSCHDGNVSTGAMMSGVSYEQTFGLLNGVGIGLNSTRSTVALYGGNPIPTFLGKGGAGPGGAYGETHPVGQTANAGAVLGTVLTGGYGLSSLVSTGKYTGTPTANTPWGNFVASYYPAALASLVAVSGSTNFGQNFVTCTTCHNQHNMAVYSNPAAGPSGVTQVRTIFFVKGGYNPGAPYDPTHEPSTMRFCQQCHFSFSSEYYGATNVGTAY
jgi:hypothetical protein